MSSISRRRSLLFGPGRLLLTPGGLFAHSSDSTPGGPLWPTIALCHRPGDRRSDDDAASTRLVSKSGGRFRPDVLGWHPMVLEGQAQKLRSVDVWSFPRRRAAHSHLRLVLELGPDRRPDGHGRRGRRPDSTSPGQPRRPEQIRQPSGNSSCREIGHRVGVGRHDDRRGGGDPYSHPCSLTKLTPWGCRPG
jgi:hypothetical protein